MSTMTPEKSGKKNQKRRNPADVTAEGTKTKKAKRAEPENGLVNPTPAPSASTSSTAAFIEKHNPQKPSARAKAGKGRDYTVSVALPGSIVLNAQTLELKTWLVGQIARTCAIFNVDEIVVFDEPASLGTSDSSSSSSSQNWRSRKSFDRGKWDDRNNEDPQVFDPNAFMIRILEYLETPQYLRKALFPMHPSLRLAGLLPPLDCPHHLRKNDEGVFREGVVLETPRGYGKTKVDVGLDSSVEVDTTAPQGTRVTVRMPSDGSPVSLTSPRAPTEESGLYWGYTVRYAPSISRVLMDCPWSAPDGAGSGYDLTIGTSERGEDIEKVSSGLSSFRHLLVVFGGLSGLELTIGNDQAVGLPAEEAQDMFDLWVNSCPGQGSRTIRTEEALAITLSRFKSDVERAG